MSNDYRVENRFQSTKGMKRPAASDTRHASMLDSVLARLGIAIIDIVLNQKQFLVLFFIA